MRYTKSPTIFDTTATFSFSRLFVTSSVVVQVSSLCKGEGGGVGTEIGVGGGRRNLRGVSGVGLSSRCHFKMRKKATVAKASLECIIVSVSSLLLIVRKRKKGMGDGEGEGEERKEKEKEGKGNYIIIRFLNKGQSKTNDSYSPPSPHTLSSYCLLFYDIVKGIERVAVYREKKM